jgi:hypothetical protein
VKARRLRAAIAPRTVTIARKGTCGSLKRADWRSPKVGQSAATSAMGGCGTAWPRRATRKTPHPWRLVESGTRRFSYSAGTSPKWAIPADAHGMERCSETRHRDARDITVCPRQEPAEGTKPVRGVRAGSPDAQRRSSAGVSRSRAVPQRVCRGGGVRWPPRALRSRSSRAWTPASSREASLDSLLESPRRL